MTLPYAMTRRACRVHRMLPAELQARVDRLILGLRLAPTAGRYNPENQLFTWSLHTDAELVQIRYALMDAPDPVLVVLEIRSFLKTALAGIHERLRAEHLAVVTG